MALVDSPRESGWEKNLGRKKRYRLVGKLKWQWKVDLLQLHSLLKMVIFHCHVRSLEGTYTPREIQGTFVDFWGCCWNTKYDQIKFTCFFLGLASQNFKPIGHVESMFFFLFVGQGQPNFPVTFWYFWSDFLIFVFQPLIRQRENDYLTPNNCWKIMKQPEILGSKKSL